MEESKSHIKFRKCCSSKEQRSSSKVHGVRAELRHTVCNRNTCIPLIAEESKGTEFQKKQHSKLRKCRCEASLVKPANKTKAGLQQKDCFKEGGLVALQSTNSCILLLGTCTEAPPKSLFAQPHPWQCSCLGRCPEHSAALPAPAEPHRHPGIPAQAFPEGGTWGWDCSCQSWQAAREAVQHWAEQLAGKLFINVVLLQTPGTIQTTDLFIVSTTTSSRLLSSAVIYLSTYPTFSFSSKKCPTFSVSFSHQQQFRFLDIFRLWIPLYICHDQFFCVTAFLAEGSSEIQPSEKPSTVRVEMLSCARETFIPPKATPVLLIYPGELQQQRSEGLEMQNASELEDEQQDSWL